MNKTEKAIVFATEAHAGQIRRLSAVPYILHPLEAAIIAEELTKNEDVICAVLLHDVVEDTDRTIEEIAEEFGERVAQLVSSDTENKRKELPPSATWRMRKEETVNALRCCTDREEKVVALSDKLSNLRALSREYEKYGDDVWNAFNVKDKRQHEWYYRSIEEELRKEFENTRVFHEFDELINKIFTDDGQ